MTPADSALLESFERFADWGARLVIIGVAGEGVEIGLKICKHKLKCNSFLKWYDKHEFSIEIWGALFWIAVVVGLWMEFGYGHKAQQLVKNENSRITQEAGEVRKVAGTAELKAGQANERAATNELAAKQLDIQLNETKAQLANAEARLNESKIQLETFFEPMNLGEEMSFVNGLRTMRGIRVEMRNVADFRSQRTAEVLSKIFSAADWRIINSSNINDFGEDGIVIGFNKDESSKKAADLLLSILKKRNVPSRTTGKVLNVPTNSIIVAVLLPPNPFITNSIAQAKDELVRLVATLGYEKTNWLILRSQREEIVEKISRFIADHDARPLKDFTESETAEYWSMVNKESFLREKIQHLDIAQEDDEVTIGFLQKQILKKYGLEANVGGFGHTTPIPQIFSPPPLQ